MDLAAVEDARDQVGVPHQHAAERVGVAAQELGGRVHHQVDAQLQRPLVDRGGEGVVDHHDGALRVGTGGQALQVEHLARRVGRALQVQDLQAFVDRGLDGGLIAGVAERHVDAQGGEERVEQLVGAAVGVLDAHHPVAAAQQRQQRVGDRRHAGRERGGGSAALERAHLLLEGGDGGVGVASVDVALGLAERHRPPLVEVGVAERDRADDRHLGGAIHERTFLTSPDGVGGEGAGAGSGAVRRAGIEGHGASQWTRRSAGPGEGRRVG